MNCVWCCLSSGVACPRTLATHFSSSSAKQLTRVSPHTTWTKTLNWFRPLASGIVQERDVWKGDVENKKTNINTYLHNTYRQPFDGGIACDSHMIALKIWIHFFQGFGDHGCSKQRLLRGFEIASQHVVSNQRFVRRLFTWGMEQDGTGMEMSDYVGISPCLQ